MERGNVRRQVLSAALEGAGAYLRYSHNPNPRIRRLRYLFLAMTLARPLMRRRAAGRATGKPDPVAQLPILIGVLSGALAYALARKFLSGNR